MAKGLEIDNWTAQLRKGVLELCILRALQREEIYAYDLVKRLAKVRGLVVSEGTVYPMLARLRRHGLICARMEKSEEGRMRKYYALTSSGVDALDLMLKAWGDLASGVMTMIEKGTSDA